MTPSPAVLCRRYTQGGIVGYGEDIPVYTMVGIQGVHLLLPYPGVHLLPAIYPGVLCPPRYTRVYYAPLAIPGCTYSTRCTSGCTYPTRCTSGCTMPTSVPLRVYYAHLCASQGVHLLPWYLRVYISYRGTSGCAIPTWVYLGCAIPTWVYLGCFCSRLCTFCSFCTPSPCI